MGKVGYIFFDKLDLSWFLTNTQLRIKESQRENKVDN